MVYFPVSRDRKRDHSLDLLPERVKTTWFNRYVMLHARIRIWRIGSEQPVSVGMVSEQMKGRVI